MPTTISGVQMHAASKLKDVGAEISMAFEHYRMRHKYR